VRGDRAQAHRGEYGDAEPVLDEFGQVLHVLRFADGVPSEYGGGAGDVDLGVEPGVNPVVDEVTFAHRRVAEFDAGPAGQRVALRDGEDQVVVADLDAGQPGGVGGAVDEGDVQLGVGGCAGEYGGCVVAEQDGDAGVGTAEAGQQGRQIDHCESLDCADVQLAAQDAADPATASRPSSAAISARRAAGNSNEKP
jgi:hypothetical protein